MRIAFLRPALTMAAIVASAGILAGGLALRPAFAVGGSAMVGPFSVTHCSQSAPCKAYSNAGMGPGLRGINTSASANGAGLLGTATVNATGVAGHASAGPGVSGISATGVGVVGMSTSAIGVLGNSTSSFGVEGTSTSSSPSVAGVQGDNNPTTIAVRANGFGGPLFVGNSSGGTDVFTVDNAGNTTLSGGASIAGLPGSDAVDAGTTASFRGASGEGELGIVGDGIGSGPFGVVAFNSGTNGGEALAAQDLSGAGVIIDGFDSGSNLKLQVQDDGTVFAHAFIASQDTPAGPKVDTYATRSRMPNIEDFGEAQLTAGQTYVRLERTFATTIDSRSAYMVFITPEGDTRGLYVTQKTPVGFVVRENQGGRSDAAFSYHIVAKPYGSTVPEMRRDVAPPRQAPRAPATLQHVPKTKP